MKTCKIEGCEKPTHARGLCNAHYKRWRKHGDPAYQRPNPDCSIEDCGKRHYARGWCRMHHERWRRHGDPLGGNERFATPEEAFEARTEPLLWSGCVVWTGATDSKGYGSLRVNGRMVLAHRYAFEREHGPIPPTREVDHMCWNRACCNVDHLRLATRQQNTQSRSGAMPGRKHDLPRGVTRRGRGYQARVRINGRTINAGTFPTIERANIAVKNCRAFYYGEYAGN